MWSLEKAVDEEMPGEWDAIYQLTFDCFLVALVGIVRDGFVPEHNYIGIEIFADKLLKRNLRSLRKFAEQDTTPLYCNTETEQNKRFAEFFGFTPVRTEGNVTLLERNT